MIRNGKLIATIRVSWLILRLFVPAQAPNRTTANTPLEV